MERFLNVGLADISAAIAGLLVVKYILKAINKRFFNCKNPIINKVNMFLIKRHKLFGITLIFTGVVHGISSPRSVLSPNLGTATWLLSILMYSSCILKKRLGKNEHIKKEGWVYYHRVVALLFVLVLAVHILTMKGIIQRYRYSSPKVTENSLTQEDNVSPEDQAIPPERQPEAKYIDGTYEGEGIGHEPGIKVSVTIDKGAISDVAVVSHNETPERCSEAMQLIPQRIVAQQSTQVDAVSGATESSMGIMEAVSDALSKASTN